MAMNLQRAITTKIALPDYSCMELIRKSKEVRVLDKDQMTDLQRIDAEPGEVLLMEGHCYSVALNTQNQWLLVQLDDTTSEEYRIQYLIQNHKQHFISLTIH